MILGGYDACPARDGHGFVWGDQRVFKATHCHTVCESASVSSSTSVPCMCFRLGHVLQAWQLIKLEVDFSGNVLAEEEEDTNNS